MRMMNIGFAVLLWAACGAARPSGGGPQEQPAVTAAEAQQGNTAAEPRISQDGDAWYVTGLSADAAAGMEQGRLFAVFRPIPGTTDSRPVAMLQAVGPAHDKAVQVALVCTARGETVDTGMSVQPLSSQTELKIGTCLARIVDEGSTGSGRRYVVLNIGAGVGVRTGDVFIILGQSITQAGFVPLGLATDQDGRCQIPTDPTHLKPTTARCELIEMPGGRAALKNGFVVLQED